VKSDSSVDNIVSIKKNKVDQLSVSINADVERLSSANETKIIDAVAELKVSVEEFMLSAFGANASLYQLKLKLIAEEDKQSEFVIQSQQASRSLKEIVRNLSQDVIAHRESLTKDNQNEVANSKKLVVFVAVLVICSLVCLSLFIIVNINRPLRKVAAALNDIARGDGDLTKRLNTNGIREVAEIGCAFNSFVDKIVTTIRKVDGASENLTSSAQNLKNISGLTADDIQIQRNETSKVAQAISDTAQAAADIAKTTATSRSSSDNVRQEADNTNKIVDDVVVVTGVYLGN